MTRIVTNAEAGAIAEACADAYSANRYRNWAAVARLLAARGYTARETEAIMRSKWMRWAADHAGAPYGRTPARAILFMLDGHPADLAREVAELVAGTFGEAP